MGSSVHTMQVQVDMSSESTPWAQIYNKSFDVAGVRKMGCCLYIYLWMSPGSKGAL